MGHHYQTIEGEGKDRNEAFWAAWDEYVRENGTRCNLRSDWLAIKDKPGYMDGGEASDIEPYGDGRPRCYAELLAKVPPMKDHVELKPGTDWSLKGRGRTVMIEHHRQVPDPDAPPELWLERWRFRVHYHA